MPSTRMEKVSISVQRSVISPASGTKAQAAASPALQSTVRNVARFSRFPVSFSPYHISPSATGSSTGRISRIFIQSTSVFIQENRASPL